MKVAYEKNLWILVYFGLKYKKKNYQKNWIYLVDDTFYVCSESAPSILLSYMILSLLEK